MDQRCGRAAHAGQVEKGDDVLGRCSSCFPSHENPMQDNMMSHDVDISKIHVRDGMRHKTPTTGLLLTSAKTNTVFRQKMKLVFVRATIKQTNKEPHIYHWRHYDA